MPLLKTWQGVPHGERPAFFVSGDRQARAAPVPPFFCRDPLQAAFPEDAGQAGQTAMAKY